jgi:hypothetical protein
MKKRARRIGIVAALTGIAVLAILVVTHWDTVRDHLEAWRFQLTRDTRTIRAGYDSDDGPLPFYLLTHLVQCPVIFDRATDEDRKGEWIRSGQDLCARGSIAGIEGRGFRALEQRLPRRAYVVMRDRAAVPADPTGETLLVPFRRP